jgi:hypothetical protein
MASRILSLLSTVYTSIGIYPFSPPAANAGKNTSFTSNEKAELRPELNLKETITLLKF